MLSKNGQKELLQPSFLEKVPIEKITLSSLVIVLLTTLAARMLGSLIDIHPVIVGMGLIFIINQILLTWKWHFRDPSLQGLEVVLTPFLITLALIFGWYLIFVELMVDYLVLGALIALILSLYVARMIHWERLLARILSRVWNWATQNKERAVGVVEVVLGMMVFLALTQLYTNPKQNVINGISAGDIAFLVFLVIANGTLNVFNMYNRIYGYALVHPLAFRSYLSGVFLVIAVIGVADQQWIISGMAIILAFYVGYPSALYLLPKVITIMRRVSRWVFSHVELAFALLEGIFTFFLPFWASSYLGNLLPFVIAILILDTFVHSISGYNKSYLYFRENPLVFRAVIFILSIIVLVIGLYFQHVFLILMASISGLLSGYPFILLAGKKCLEFFEGLWNWIRVHWLLLVRSVVTALGILILVAGVIIQNELFVIVGILVIGVINIDVVYDALIDAYHILMTLLVNLRNMLIEALEFVKKSLKDLLRLIKEYKFTILRAMATIGGVGMIIGGTLTSQYYLIPIGLTLVVGVNFEFVRRLTYQAYLFLKAEGLKLARYLLMFVGGLLIFVGFFMQRTDLMGIGIVLITIANIYHLVLYSQDFYQWLVMEFKKRPLDVLVGITDGLALVGYLAGIFLGNQFLQQAGLLITVVATGMWALIHVVVFVYKNSLFLREHWVDILRTLLFSASMISFIASFVWRDMRYFFLGLILLILTVVDRIYFILRNLRVYLTNLLIWLTPWVKTVLYAIGALLAIGSASQVLAASFLPKELQVIPLPEFSLLVSLSISIALGLVGVILIWQAYLVRPDEETRQKFKFPSASTLSNDLSKKEEIFGKEHPFMK